MAEIGWWNVTVLPTLLAPIHGPCVSSVFSGSLSYHHSDNNQHTIYLQVMHSVHFLNFNPASRLFGWLVWPYGISSLVSSSAEESCWGCSVNVYLAVQQYWRRNLWVGSLALKLVVSFLTVQVVAKLSWVNSDKVWWAGLLCFDHSLGKKQDGNDSWLFDYSHDLSRFEYTYPDNIGMTTKCVFESALLCVSMSRASFVANAPFPSPNENKHKNRWQWGYTTTPARSVPSRRCQKLTWTWACTDVSKRCIFHRLGQSWKRWKVICMHELFVSTYAWKR